MQNSFMLANWCIEPASGQIHQNDTEHNLEPKAMDVLVYLAQHAGEAVTRSDLEQAVWHDTVVTYEALTVTINKIRSVLGDDPRNPVYIETLPKRGYRLIAPVNFDYKKTERFSHPGRKKLIWLLPVLLLGLIASFIFNQVQNPDKVDIIDSEGLALPRQDIPSIAIIPFANNSNDPEQDYFASGITEYLITDLSHFPGLLVTSRNSVLGFNSKTVNIRNASQLLHVRYILTGSVLKNKNRMRIAVQLTDTNNGIQIWADRFDRNVDDLFTVQDEISQQIITELVKQVKPEKNQPIERRHTTNHEAHDYYIRGNALYTSISKEGNSLARELYFKALEIDPDFAVALGAIALTYVDDYRRKWGKDPEHAVDLAFEYANKAIAIDKNAAVAYVVLAYVQLYGRKQPEKALTAARQAIKLSPNYADAYAILGSAYSFIGRPLDAIRATHHALRQNPIASVIYYANLGRDYYFLRQPEKAIEHLENAIFRNENYINAHIYLAATYASLDRMDDARWEVEKIMTLDPEFSLSYWSGTQPYRLKEPFARMQADLHKAGLEN